MLTGRAALTLLIVFTASPWNFGRPTGQQHGASFAVRDIRVFDGQDVLHRATVVVEEGVITAVGAHVTIPAGTRVIEGAGRTLLPGLIDAHTHTQSADELEVALAFGVTTQLDMDSLPNLRPRCDASQPKGARMRGRIYYRQVSP